MWRSTDTHRLDESVLLFELCHDNVFFKYVADAEAKQQEQQD
jgi:hypothetical protein